MISMPFPVDRILHPDTFAETVCGSPLYMAPEILQFQKYDEKVGDLSTTILNVLERCCQHIQ